MRVLQRLREHATATPDAPAVVAGDVTLGYRELVRRVDHHRDRFTSAGVTPRDVVLLALPRDADMHAVVLALLSLGVPYVPVARGSSRDRVRGIAERIGARWLVGDRWGWDTQGTPLAAGDGPPVVRWSVPDAPALPDGLAYVIFTSGSTGEPKGVMVGRDALESLLDAMRERLRVPAQVRMLAAAPLSFDMSVPELFLPFLAGGCVVVADDESRADLTRLARLVGTCTLAQATPSMWNLLLDSGWRPRPGQVVVAGGEALGMPLARRLCVADEVWNLYGPTEATVWASAWRVDPAAPRVVLGEPLAHARLHLLPLPDGETELGISGPCLADGYAADPATTARVFVDTSGTRVYRTGDVVQRHPDGSVEWVRRTDSLVKVRGHRISTLEVQAAVESAAGVTGCVVDVVGPQGAATEMVAYVTLGRGDVTAVAAHVRATLPPYLVPDRWVVVDAFPLNASGKCDVRRLRELVATPAPPPPAPVAPARGSSPAQDALTDRLGQILPAALVDRTASFRSLGLTSSRAMILAALLGQDLGLDVTAAAVVAADSSATLAAHLDTLTATTAGEPAHV